MLVAPSVPTAPTDDVTCWRAFYGAARCVSRTRPAAFEQILSSIITIVIVTILLIVTLTIIITSHYYYCLHAPRGV